jgi:hypothetical protein
LELFHGVADARCGDTKTFSAMSRFRRRAVLSNQHSTQAPIKKRGNEIQRTDATAAVRRASGAKVDLEARELPAALQWRARATPEDLASLCDDAGASGSNLISQLRHQDAASSTPRWVCSGKLTIARGPELPGGFDNCATAVRQRT